MPPLRRKQAPLILLILIVGIAAGGWFGLLPYLYNSGTEQMAAGNWNEAINTFNKISFSGEKTYDRDGNNHSESGRIGYKLYDPEGYVAKSGSVYTTDVAVGERFRDATLTFNDIIPGEYKLVLLDVE